MAETRMSDIPKVTQLQAAGILRANLQANVPTYICGPPGGGKTQIGGQVAEGLGWGWHTSDGLSDDVADMNGMPENTGAMKMALALCIENSKERAELAQEIRRSLAGDTGVCHWQKPGRMPTTPGPGVVWIDEIPQAGQRMQAAMMKVFEERRFGEHRLPEGWVPSGAGNRVGDRAGAGHVVTALMDRVTVLEMIFNHRAWVEHTETVPWFPPVIRAFAEFKPETISNFVPTQSVSATPRSWFRVARQLSWMPKALRLPAFGGNITEGYAIMFCAFLDTHERLPSTRDLLANCETFTLMTEPSLCWAMTSALAEKAKDANLDELNRILVVARRLGSTFGFRLIRDVFAARREDMTRWTTQDVCAKAMGNPVTKVPAYFAFIDQHGEVFPKHEKN